MIKATLPLLSMFATADAFAGDFEVMTQPVYNDVPVSTREDVSNQPGWSATATATLADGVFRIVVTEDRRCTRETIDTIDRTITTKRTASNPKALRTSWIIGIGGVALGGGAIGAMVATPAGLTRTEPVGTRNGVPTGPGDTRSTATADVGLLAAGVVSLAVGGRALLSSATLSVKLRDDVNHVGNVDITRSTVVEGCGHRVPAGAAVKLLSSHVFPAREDTLYETTSATLDADGTLSIAISALGDTDLATLSSWTATAVRIEDTEGTFTVMLPKDSGFGPAMAAERKRRKLASIPGSLEPCFKLYEQAIGGAGVSARDAMLNPYATTGKAGIWNLDAFERGVGLDAATYVYTLMGCNDTFDDLRCEAAITLPPALAQRMPANDHRLVGSLSSYRGMTMLGPKDIPRLDAACWTDDVEW